MLKLPSYIATVALTSIAMSAPTRTAAQTDSTRTLPTVSVTATRGTASILTTPLAVTKISTQTLRQTNGYGLDEALSRVPGVLAQSRFGTSDVRIVIRGFGARGAGDRSNAGTSRGIRVLIDGIPETEPDGRTSFDQIDLATASAIEVIRSNASSLWGNAAGGVINVLSPPTTTSPSIELQPVTGSFGLRRVALRSSTPLSGGSAWANYTNTTFEGWREHSSSRRGLFNAGVLANVGENTRVGVYASGANHLFHIPGPLTQAQVDADPNQANATYASRNERRHNRILRLGGSIEHDISDATSISGMMFLSPKFLQRSERNTFRDFTRYHVGGNIVGRTQMQVSPTVRSNLTVGVDEAFQDGAILFYSLVNGERGPTLMDNKSEGANNFGVFAQEDLQFGDRLRVMLGARHDNVTYYSKSFINPDIDDSKSFKRLTPKVGVSWLLRPTMSVYGNLGGGIEVPAGNETDPAPNSGTIGINPLLEPIKSTTIEGGFKALSLSPAGLPVSLRYDIAVYRTALTDDIAPYNAGRFYMPAGKSRRTGLEVAVEGESSTGFFGAGVTMSSNKYLEYSVDSSLFKTGGLTAVFDGNKIVGIPDVMATFDLGTTVPGLRAVRVKGGVEHVGKYFADDANDVEVPGYTTFSLSAELAKPIVTANGWGIRAFLSVHNLTDKAYIGSAFLNPDRNAAGEPVAFEPGGGRSIVFSITAGRLQ